MLAFVSRKLQRTISTRTIAVAEYRSYTLCPISFSLSFFIFVGAVDMYNVNVSTGHDYINFCAVTCFEA